MKERENNYGELAKLVREQGLIMKQHSAEIATLKDRFTTLRDLFAKIIVNKKGDFASDDLERVGRLIQKHRTINNMSQTELADKAKITQKTVSLLEVGKIPKPRAATLSSIFQALDIPPDQIASEIWSSEKETA